MGGGGGGGGGGGHLMLLFNTTNFTHKHHASLTVGFKPDKHHCETRVRQRAHSDVTMSCSTRRLCETDVMVR